jgi:surface antigen
LIFAKGYVYIFSSMTAVYWQKGDTTPLLTSGMSRKSEWSALMASQPKKILMLIVLLAFVVAACETAPGPKTTIGGLGGAAAGGLIGAAAGGGATGIAAGVLLGGLLGAAVGDRLDAADQRRASQAAHQAFEYNQTGSSATWRNPDNGNYGTITPVRTYQSASGMPCREYQQTIYIGGEPQQGHGTACRQADGTWKIMN